LIQMESIKVICSLNNTINQQNFTACALLDLK
jgi:hypothetical protein